MNKLSALSIRRDKSHYSEISDGDANEITQLSMQSSRTPPISNLAHDDEFNDEDKQSTDFLNSVEDKPPSTLAIICYFMRQNCASLTIVVLLTIIFALAGEHASTRNQATNLIENEASANSIKWRPCQIYIHESDGSVEVLQTSFGDPSNQWGKIPCLVQRHDAFDLDIPRPSGGDVQWNWLYDSVAGKPVLLEYGQPSAQIKADFKTAAFPDRDPIMGFGGAFTEASALNYMSLDESGRSAIMELLFGKDGLGYSLGRVHMNSCDFSVKSYNFDDTDGDFELENFDQRVEHDVGSGMVEMMLQADKVSRKDWPEKGKKGIGVRIIASPWSPPAWMKKPTWRDPPGSLHAVNMTGSAEPNCLREGTGPESRYAKAWALYFSKFISAYKAWGINLFGVTVQNEPEFPAPWEACAYNPENQGSFIMNHLGPQLRDTHPDIKLLMFDHNKDHVNIWGKSILNQTNPASDFVDGTGVHWYAGGMDRLLDGAQGQPNLHKFVSMLKHLKVKSDHLLLGTEACHCPSTGYQGGDLKVAWARAERYAHTILSDLAAGSNGWIEWNLVLDAIGGPNHLGNMCDAPLLAVPYRAGRSGKQNISSLPNFEHSYYPFGPVVGDSQTKEELHARGVPAEYLERGVVVQPMFYYMGHISRHVRPGSRSLFALVDESGPEPESRTFHQKIDNVTVIVGGGINDLARSGVEVTAWPCEGSTRQEWIQNDDGMLQVFGHDWLGAPTSSCISKVVDPSFGGLLLKDCDDGDSGSFSMSSIELENGGEFVKFALQNEEDSCLAIKRVDYGANGARGGVQVGLASCDESSALWKFNVTTGEISSSFFDEGEVCLTTGWPFLQVGAFSTPNGDNVKNTLIVLNEASEPANYVLRDEDNIVVMSNSIPGHSIQTIIRNNN